MTEDEFNKLKARVLEIENNLSKNPYECPVCKGMCKFSVFGQNRTANCPACRGKGIVWNKSKPRSSEC